MIGRLVSFCIALAAAAAAAAVLVVSATFAFYAFLRTYLGPAGAAACVTLAAAIVVAGLAFYMFGRSKGSKPKAPRSGAENGLVDRLTAMVSDRPVVAASAAVAAGLLAWRNPTLVSTLLRLADSQPPERKRR